MDFTNNHANVADSKGIHGHVDDQTATNVTERRRSRVQSKSRSIYTIRIDSLTQNLYFKDLRGTETTR